MEKKITVFGYGLIPDAEIFNTEKVWGNLLDKSNDYDELDPWDVKDILEKLVAQSPLKPFLEVDLVPGPYEDEYKIHVPPMMPWELAEAPEAYRALTKEEIEDEIIRLLQPYLRDNIDPEDLRGKMF
jgi:hypothetical protein